MILGLDISSSIIGYCVIDENENIIEISYIDLRKVEELFDKVKYTLQELFIVKEKYDIIKIGIEDFLQKFAFGKSSIKTIIKLSQINTLVSYEIYNTFCIRPIFFNSRSARKIVLGKSYNKEETFQIISQKYNSVNWPKKKNNTYADQAYDMSDSLIISLATLKY